MLQDIIDYFQKKELHKLKEKEAELLAKVKTLTAFIDGTESVGERWANKFIDLHGELGRVSQQVINLQESLDGSFNEKPLDESLEVVDNEKQGEDDDKV